MVVALSVGKYEFDELMFSYLKDVATANAWTRKAYEDAGLNWSEPWSVLG